jgi:hypothetical protein
LSGIFCLFFLFALNVCFFFSFLFCFHSYIQWLFFLCFFIQPCQHALLSLLTAWLTLLILPNHCQVIFCVSFMFSFCFPFMFIYWSN